MDRRKFINLAVLPAISATPLALLSACGAGTGPSTPAPTPTPSPTPTPTPDPSTRLTFQKNASRPIVVCAGDSTMANSHAMSSFATSLVYNGNGTASITFAAPQDIAVGDMIGIQSSLDTAFKVIEKPVLSITGSTYTYALNAGQVPAVNSDTSTEIMVRFVNRASAAGPITALNGLTGRNLKLINAGQSGDTIALVLKRFDVDLAPQAAGNRILFTIGINDTFGKGLTLAAMQEGMNSLLAKCKAINAKLDILTPFPQPDTRKNWSTTKRDIFAAFRAWLVSWSAENGLNCIDWAKCSAGGLQVQDPTSANGNPSANMVQADKVHPTSLGAWLAAEQYANFYNTLFKTSVNQTLPRTISECGMLTSGLFTGNAGTALNGTGNVSGQIATGVTVTMSAGTGSATCYLTPRSIAQDGDEAGNWQGVSLNAVAAGDQVQIRLPNLRSSIANGDLIRIQGLARIVAGPNMIKEFSFFCNSQTATTRNLLVTDMLAGSGQMAPFAKNFTMMMGADVPVREPLGVHGAPSNFIPTIEFTAAAAGSMTIEIACWVAGWVV